MQFGLKSHEFCKRIIGLNDDILPILGTRRGVAEGIRGQDLWHHRRKIFRKAICFKTRSYKKNCIFIASSRQRKNVEKNRWARPGFEPGTTRTLSEYHTPRPTSQRYFSFREI